MKILTNEDIDNLMDKRKRLFLSPLSLLEEAEKIIVQRIHFPEGMTEDQMHFIVNWTERLITRYDATIPARMHAGDFRSARIYPETLEHALWMCQRARTLIDTGEKEKAMRCIGFIQGVLWAEGVCTIDQLKDINSQNAFERKYLLHDSTSSVPNSEVPSSSQE